MAQRTRGKLAVRRWSDMGRCVLPGIGLCLLLAGCHPRPADGTVQTSRAQLLLDNALKYADPKHGLIDPVSGYPVEGWNQDTKRGLFLRTFTQLTAVGEWIELLANVVAGRAEIPNMSEPQARAALMKAVTTLRKAQQADPTDITMMNNLAAALAEMGNLEEAAALFDKALEAVGEDQHLLESAATLRARLGDRPARAGSRCPAH